MHGWIDHDGVRLGRSNQSILMPCIIGSLLHVKLHAHNFTHIGILINFTDDSRQLEFQHNNSIVLCYCGTNLTLTPCSLDTWVS